MAIALSTTAKLFKVFNPHAFSNNPKTPPLEIVKLDDRLARLKGEVFLGLEYSRPDDVSKKFSELKTKLQNELNPSLIADKETRNAVTVLLKNAGVDGIKSLEQSVLQSDEKGKSLQQKWEEVKKVADQLPAILEQVRKGSLSVTAAKSEIAKSQKAIQELASNIDQYVENRKELASQIVQANKKIAEEMLRANIAPTATGKLGIRSPGR